MTWKKKKLNSKAEEKERGTQDYLPFLARKNKEK